MMLAGEIFLAWLGPAGANPSAATPYKDTLDMLRGWGNQAFALIILGPLAGYIGTRVKSWTERNNVRARRNDLCEDAAALIKFHATLADATVPSSRVQSAQACIANELDHVLEKLSQSLTNPQASAQRARSGTIITLENWLLLYRPCGFWSWLLHALFFMMVPLWFLVFYVGFINDLRAHTHDAGVGVVVLLIFAIPIVLCNFIARKVDARARQRQDSVQAAVLQAVTPK
jgi:hypothetical protein